MGERVLLVSSIIFPKVYASLEYWPIADLSLPEKVKSSKSLGGALNPISDTPLPGEERCKSFFFSFPLNRSNKIDCTFVDKRRCTSFSYQ